MSVKTTVSDTGPWVGQPLPRREDARLTAGAGTFTDDIRMPGILHAAFLRSPHAHARIVKINAEKARALKGVHAVITGEDVERLTKPISTIIPFKMFLPNYCLAVDKARYVGEPVAAIAAVDRATAEDAAELIEVEYEPLPAVVDPWEAIEQPPSLVFDEIKSNVIWHDTFSYGEVDDAFARAAHVVSDRFSVQRYISTALETMGVIGKWDSSGLTLWSGDQRPGFATHALTTALQIPHSQIRLVSPDIGGGFGNKRKATYMVIVALLARAADRPVKYLEDRQENLLGLVHASNQVMDLEMALDADGKILGLKLRDVVDEGSNVINPTLHSMLKFTNMLNNYTIPAVRFEGYAVLTNKCHSGANRGIGKPFMCFVIERAIEMAAKKVGIGSLELRRRNFIPASAMPYESPMGNVYDSGDFFATLDTALKTANYDDLLKEQEEARRAGRYFGIGIATAVEPNSLNLSAYTLMTGRTDTSGVGEGALVRMEGDGSVRVSLGNTASGQGYETVVAQIVADELGIHPHRVTVAPGFDSAVNPWLHCSGSFANKFSGTDVGAIIEAARTIRGKILRIAAHLTGRKAEELTIREAAIWVHGANEPLLPLAKVAMTAYRDLLRLPEGEMPGLEARHFYVDPQSNLPAMSKDDKRLRFQLTFSNSAHIAVTEVNPDTGAVKIHRYVIAHDCGREINPMLVEGMVHGATTHGIGGALYEDLIYDKNGQMLAGSFMDYLKPTALDVPEFEVVALETPSPFTPLGAKGVGEGGSIPSLAAITNSVEDALKPLGVTLTELPLTPNKIWDAIQKARGEGKRA
ncbi:MAG: xanthine dehydrogenase family protein molybdopterin-binding subunit [Xanthobacteraceae bacterium]|nr:xanthine dehydrogenase family protein molybdopterin-binding subunit [Xanthobacteraceae bacterium]